MSRLIEHDATGPRKLDASDLHPEKGDIAICQCGLSAEYPFCDGSHRATSEEDPERLYRYDNDVATGDRHVIEAIEYADGEE
ncbi:MAG: CDGSH iron-sulfur domain-containing protein [Halobacteriales archaeon]|nr:CDGSH iron-sulfur domain-containing protein [Halobacteriales archaeon]